MLGATLWLSPDLPPRFHIRLWPGSGGKPVDLWSNVDLLKLHNAEFPALRAAYLGREKARAAREAALRENPPVPQDATIHYRLRRWTHAAKV
jgi:hypothetical protein